MNTKKLNQLTLVLFLFLSFAVFVLVGYYYLEKDQSSEESKASDKFPLSDLPTSTSTINSSGAWTLTKSNVYTAGSDWGELDERKVYHTSLKHEEGLSNSWEFRIGKGSQIYSIRNSQGELIGKQVSDGEWVDRVLQTVMVNNALGSSEEKYFIHQSGTYANDGLDFPFYSPILSESFNQTTKTYSTVVWPQQAHIPTNFTSKMLVEQHVKDLGDGVVEISYVYHNFGNDLINFINTPWVGLNRSNNPIYLVSKTNGDYYEMTENIDWQDNIIKNKDTAGWFAVAESNETTARGLGIIVGRNKYRDEPFSNRESVVRFGPQGKNNLTIFSSITFASIEAHTSFFFRYYLVVNTLGKIQQYGNLLADKVEYGTLSFKENKVRKIPICKKTISGITRFSRNCEGSTPIFYTYDRLVNGGNPIFVLENTSNGSIVYTDNPYELSKKPYDGKAEYLEYLGWAIPASESKTDCYSYKRLTSVLGESYKGTANLMVRANNSSNCENQKCSDGTINNQCSTVKPQFCQNGDLISKCSVCGCPSRQTCQNNGSCKAEVSEIVCGPMDTNGDNKLTIIDLSNFVKAYGKKCKDNAPTSGCKGKDTNRDGKVTLIDLSNFVRKYGKKSCVN
jgi:hypothetical protein